MSLLAREEISTVFQISHHQGATNSIILKEICESSNIFGVIKAFKCSLVELVECSVCWGEDSESSVGSIRAEGVHEVCNP